MNQGIHATDYGGLNIFLYGTNRNADDTQSEQIVQLKRDLDKDKDKDLKLKLIKSFGLPEISQKAIPDGLIFDGYNTIIVVTKNALRKY